MVTVLTTTNSHSANSFVDVAYLKQYATQRAIDINHHSDEQLSAHLIRAIDYLLAVSFGGEKTIANQYLPFPRDGVSTVPRAIQKAQCQLAIESLTTDLQPNATPQIQKEKVDSLEVQYFQQQQTNSRKVFAKVENLLAPYLATSNQQQAVLIQTVRA